MNAKMNKEGMACLYHSNFMFPSFTRYIYDEETELYYLRSRFYNSKQMRFINADVLYSTGNVFTYCSNRSTMFSDHSGMIMDHLEEYFKMKKDKRNVDDYTVAELTTDNVNFRYYPYIVSKNPERYSMDDIDHIYVNKRFIFEGDDTPESAINPDPNRVWFEVIIFSKRIYPQGEAMEGYMCADYINMPLGGNNRTYTSAKINVREEPNTDKYRKFELEEGICVTPLYADPKKNWFFCCTPKGSGWIDRTFLWNPG